MSDEQCSTLFHRAVDTLDPDVAAIVAGGIARGRRLRRRRAVVRVGEGATAVAVVGGIAATGIVLASGGSSHPRLLQPGASSSAAVSSSATTTPTAPAVARVPITPQVALQTAIDLLPRKGTTTHLAGRYDNSGWVGGEFVYNDGHGAAEIAVSVTPAALAQPHGHADAVAQVCGPEGTGCSTLPNGDKVATNEGPEYPEGVHEYNATERDVRVVRSDGIFIELMEWNASQAKDAPITRPAPPFTLDELTTIAESPSWQLTVTAQTAQADAGMFHTYNVDTQADTQADTVGGTATASK